jgi:hypothetical protein
MVGYWTTGYQLAPTLSWIVSLFWAVVIFSEGIVDRWQYIHYKFSRCSCRALALQQHGRY